jgi:DNA-binding transcriptional LysR family regulator
MKNPSISDDDVGGSTPRQQLNLRQIEVFWAIMVAGSVSAAGRMLHVSQPAISRVLSLTESRLGFQLFERQRTRLLPTPEARRLFAEVESLYRGIQRVNDLASNLALSGEGKLRIVTNASFGERLVPMAIERFCKRNLGVKITCRTVNHDELTARFLTGDADIGITMLAPEHANLQAVELGDDQLICLIPASHPLAAKSEVHAEELTSASWMGYPAETPMGHMLLSLIGPTIAHSSQIEVHSPAIAIAFAQQGLGAALVAEWSLPLALAPGMVVRPFIPTIPVKIWAVYSKLEPLPAMAHRFLRAVGHVLLTQKKLSNFDVNP